MSANSPRRRFLKTIAAGSAALASASLSFPAIAKRQTYQWKMVTAWPKNFPALGIGANHLAKQLETLSEGRIKVTVYGAGELVPAFEIFDLVSKGTAELGHGAAYYWKGKVPAAQFFASIPFGFTAQEMNAWLYYGNGLSLWQEVYAPFNLIPFPVGNTDVQMGGWFNKRINGLEDLKGLKIRIPGIGGDVIARSGAVPVNIPGAEIFTALKSGTIDAVEWVGPYNDLAFGLHRAAKYYYTPGWHEPGTTLECFINRSVYLALPKELQAIVRAACQIANLDMTADFTAQNATAYQRLVNDHHVTVKPLPAEVLQQLQQNTQSVLHDLSQHDALTKKVYAAYEQFRRKIVPYHNVTLREYLDQRR